MPYPLLDLILSNGGEVTEEGYIRACADGPAMPFRWTFSDHLPKPEDFVLKRSKVTLDEIYAAGEWEQIGPQMPAPKGMEGLSPTPRARYCSRRGRSRTSRPPSPTIPTLRSGTGKG